MNKTYTFIINCLVFLFFSENVLSQSTKISENSSKNQIVNGIKVTHISKKKNSDSVSIISHSSNNIVD